MSQTYFALAAVVVFMGIVSGIILAFIAKEELKQGKRYFVLMRNLLLALIVVFLLYFYYINKYLILIISVLLFLSLSKINLKKDYIVYWLTGIVLLLVSKNKDFLLIESILIFLYGLPAGTLFAMRFIKDWKVVVNKLFLCYGWFLVITLPFLFIS